MIVKIPEKNMSIEFPDDMKPQEAERIIYNRVYHTDVLSPESKPETLFNKIKKSIPPVLQDKQPSQQPPGLQSQQEAQQAQHTLSNQTSQAENAVKTIKPVYQQEAQKYNDIKKQLDNYKLDKGSKESVAGYNALVKQESSQLGRLKIIGGRYQENVDNYNKLYEQQAKSQLPQDVIDRALALKPDKDPGETALAIAPYLAVKAIQGITSPALPALKAIGMDTEGLLNTAAEYWHKKLPYVGVPNVDISKDKNGILTINRIDDTPLSNILGSTAQGLGYIAPMGGALKAGGLVADQAAEYARPFYRSILQGMIGGGLLGEGKKDKTLENMALFGLFEGAGYAANKAADAMEAVKKARVAAEEQAHRMATIQERGLVAQNISQVLAKNPDLSLADLSHMSEQYYKEIMAMNRADSEPATPLKPGEQTPDGGVLPSLPVQNSPSLSAPAQGQPQGASPMVIPKTKGTEPVQTIPTPIPIQKSKPSAKEQTLKELEDRKKEIEKELRQDTSAEKYNSVEKEYNDILTKIDAAQKPEPKEKKTVEVWVKSKFSNKGAYKDFPVLREEKGITLYQGGNGKEKRQFWTPDRKYASQFGRVKKKTGDFYLIDNGNRMTKVYVPIPDKNAAELRREKENLKQLKARRLEINKQRGGHLNHVPMSDTLGGLAPLKLEYSELQRNIKKTQKRIAELKASPKVMSDRAQEIKTTEQARAAIKPKPKEKKFTDKVYNLQGKLRLSRAFMDEIKNIAGDSEYWYDNRITEKESTPEYVLHDFRAIKGLIAGAKTDIKSLESDGMDATSNRLILDDARKVLKLIRPSEQEGGKDLRGYNYAIVKNGEVVSSGGIPEGMEVGLLTSEQYYKDMADQYEGDLYLSKRKRAPKERSSEDLIFGKTWKEIQDMQSGVNTYRKITPEMPKGAVKVYSAKRPESEPIAPPRKDFVKETLGDSYKEGITVKPTIPKFMPILKDPLGRKTGIVITDKGSFSNGHWLLKKGYLTPALKKRFPMVGGVRAEAYPEKELWPKRTEAAYFDFSIKEPKYGDVAVFTTHDGLMTAFNEKYIAYLQKNIPNFSLQVTANDRELKPALIYSGKEKAGLLNPLGSDQLMGLKKAIERQHEATPSNGETPVKSFSNSFSEHAVAKDVDKYLKENMTPGQPLTDGGYGSGTVGTYKNHVVFELKDGKYVYVETQYQKMPYTAQLFEIKKSQVEKEKPPGSIRGASIYGNASESGFAKDTELGASEQKSRNYSSGEQMPVAIDLPEIVELARQLMDGELPAIKRKLGKNVAGWFIPSKGKVEILAEIFKDPEIARKVVAHELGHLIDWLPNKDLRRGNILGRIASLKRHTRGKIPLDPRKKPPELTEERLKELAKEAQKLARADADELIDEEIYKESGGVSPEEVLAIWNDANVESWIDKKLLDFVKSLDSATKKSVVRQALKNEPPKELTSFVKTIKVKTGKKIKVGGYREKLKKRYKDLIAKELRFREYVYNSQIRKELKAFTIKWKPFDLNKVDKAYKAYRFSGKELYADALSALITNPAFLKEQAPTFYKAFFNYLHSKPKVEDIYASIQDQLAFSPEGLAAQRAQNLESGFKRGLEARKIQLKRAQKALSHPWEWAGVYLFDKNMPIYNRAIWKVENKRDANGNLTEAAKRAIHLRASLESLANFSTMAQVYTSEIRHKVIEPLMDNNISVSNLSYYMFQKRVIGERFDIANPGGNYKELSEKDLASIMRRWGKEKRQLIQKVAWDYRDIREKEILPIFEKGGLIKPDLMKHIWNTKDYATFAVYKYFEDSFGSGTSSKIFQQHGTFQEVDNLLDATMIKDIQMMRASKLNMLKQQFEEVANGNDLGLLSPADLKYSLDSKARIPVDPKDRELSVFTVFHDGKPVHYYAPKAVVDVFKYDPVRGGGAVTILRWLGILPRAIFVSYNPVFMARNPERDFFETVKNIKGVRARDMGKLLAKYKEAYPEVLKYIFKEIMSPDIKAMAKEGMFPKTRMWGATDQTVSGEVLHLIEQATLEMDDHSARGFKKLRERFSKLLDTVDKGGEVQELVSKVAGYKYLMAHTDEPLDKVGFAVRDLVGTPNYRKSGKLNWLTNNLFPFSTVRINGLKASYASTKDNSGAYIWKTILFNIIPALVRWGIKYGWPVLIGELILNKDKRPKTLQTFLDKMSPKERAAFLSNTRKVMGSLKHVQRMMQGVSEYDMNNYNIIPLYLRKDGKTVYLRLPQDYEGQYISNIVGHLTSGKIIGKDSLLNAFWQAEPNSLNPFVSQPWMWIQYLAQGKSPVDNWTAEPVLTDTERQAGGIHAIKKLAQYSWEQTGAQVIYQPAWGRLQTDRGPWEKILNSTPGNILGTFIKISDKGITDQIWNKIEAIKKKKAREALEKKDAYIQLANGEIKSAKDILTVLTDGSKKMKEKLTKLLVEKSGNVYARAFARAVTIDEKAAVLEIMLKDNYVQTPKPNK